MGSLPLSRPMRRALQLRNRIDFFISTPHGIFNLGNMIPALQGVPWNNLGGLTITNKNVFLFGYDDIHERAPIFECENLILDGCSPSFVGKWLQRSTFPLVKRVYLGSQPISRYVLMTNNSAPKFDKVYLHEQYSEYKYNWWYELESVKLISAADYRSLIECEEDDLRLKE